MANSEPAGANCSYGGSNFTAVNGTTYACNGAPGAAGAPGAGSASVALATGYSGAGSFNLVALSSNSLGAVVLSSSTLNAPTNGMTLLVTGQLQLTQQYGGRTENICWVLLDGNPIGNPVYTFMSSTLGESAYASIVAHTTGISAGAHSVSLSCSTSDTSQNVFSNGASINVLAVA